MRHIFLFENKLMNLDCWGFFRDFCFHFDQYSDGILCSATQLENLVFVDRFATRFCFLTLKKHYDVAFNPPPFPTAVLLSFVTFSNLFSKSKGTYSKMKCLASLLRKKMLRRSKLSCQQEGELVRCWVICESQCSSQVPRMCLRRLIKVNNTFNQREYSKQELRNLLEFWENL